MANAFSAGVLVVGLHVATGFGEAMNTQANFEIPEQVHKLNKIAGGMSNGGSWRHGLGDSCTFQDAVTLAATTPFKQNGADDSFGVYDGRVDRSDVEGLLAQGGQVQA